MNVLMTRNATFLNRHFQMRRMNCYPFSTRLQLAFIPRAFPQQIGVVMASPEAWTPRIQWAWPIDYLQKIEYLEFYFLFCRCSFVNCNINFDFPDFGWEARRYICPSTFTHTQAKLDIFVGCLYNMTTQAWFSKILFLEKYTVVQI